MIKNLLPILFLFAGFQANASIIDSGSYTTDTNSGLDWLDVTLSMNRSYDDVSAEFGSLGDFEGWRYASGLEFEQLWANISSVNDNGPHIAEVYNIDESGFSIDPFVSMLGDTYDAFFTSTGTGQTSDNAHGGLAGEGIHFSNGLISDYDVFGGNNARYFAMAYDYAENGVDADIDYTSSRNGYQTDFGINPTSGSWLVRDTVTVPEPSIIALLGLGLVGVGFARRRQS